jgi:hypothetical protein
LPIILGDDFNPNFKTEEVKKRWLIPDNMKSWDMESNFQIIEALEYLKKKGIIKDIGNIIVYEEFYGRRDFEEGKKDTGKVIGNYNKPETLADMLKYNHRGCDAKYDNYWAMDIRLEIDKYEAYEALSNYNKYTELISAINNV